MRGTKSVPRVSEKSYPWHLRSRTGFIKNSDVSLDNHADPVLEGLKRMHETRPSRLVKRRRDERGVKGPVKVHTWRGKRERERKGERKGGGMINTLTSRAEPVPLLASPGDSYTSVTR